MKEVPMRPNPDERLGRRTRMRVALVFVTAALLAVGVMAPSVSFGHTLGLLKAKNAIARALPQAFGWSSTSEDHFLVDRCSRVTAHKVRCKYHMYGRDSGSNPAGNGPYVFHCHGLAKALYRGSHTDNRRRVVVLATEPSGCSESFSYDENGNLTPGPLPH